MSINDLALLVYQVVCWPIMIVEIPPSHKLIIQCNRIVDPITLDGSLNVIWIFFKIEFRAVYANDNQSLVVVFLIKMLEIRQRSDAINTRIGPKIDEHDVAF